jgi:hypothetical protein
MPCQIKSTSNIIFHLSNSAGTSWLGQCHFLLGLYETSGFITSGKLSGMVIIVFCCCDQLNNGVLVLVHYSFVSILDTRC